MKNNYQDKFKKRVNTLIDYYFNSYDEYNEETINDFFTGLFYSYETEEDLDIANEAEQQIRDMVFNGSVKHEA